MARIDVKTTVTAPAEINIPLVRADYASTSNVFRAFFEIFLSLFSGLLGFVLSLQVREPIHWVSLIICGGAALAFLVFTVFYGRQSKKV